MPLRDNTYFPSALVMGGGAVIIGVVYAKAPPTVLPQGAIPFIMVGFFVATFEAIGEGGVLAFMTLVLGYGT